MAAAAGVATPAWPAGTINHSEIIERAIVRIEASGGREYLALLQNNRGFAYYGSMFPDWGYAKAHLDPNPPADYAMMAEIAHDTAYYQYAGWRSLGREEARDLPKFWQTLLAHAAPRAPSGSDAALAFLFGVVSHQVSDGAFHFTQADLPRAFQPEAEQWHLVDPPMAHWYLELGLDRHFELVGFIRAQCPLAPILCVSWDYPGFSLDSIVEAYKASSHDGDSPTVPALLSGPVWQMVVYQGELSEPVPTPLSGWVMANLYSWPAGGVADMVDLTIAAWDETWRVLKKYAPLTVATLAPETPDGNNDWYRQPVTLVLEGEDTYRDVTNYGAPFHTYYQPDGSAKQEYFGPLILSTEGQTNLSLSSVDAFANSEKPQTMLLKIDMTPPAVTVDTPSVLTRVQPLAIRFGGYDPQPGSGLFSLTALLNQQPVTDGQVIDPFWWAPQGHSLNVTGEDYAGWLTRQSHGIELQATLESLQATVSRLCQQGYVTKPGICNALSAKLAAALAARNRGDFGAMAGVLNAFQNAVSAQAGKAILDQAAWLLLADSDYVLTH